MKTVDSFALCVNNKITDSLLVIPCYIVICYIRLLADLMNRGDGFITIEEFRPFCNDNQDFLSPLFKIQQKLKEATLGSAFWEDMANRTVELGRNHTVSLAELMIKVH